MSNFICNYTKVFRVQNHDGKGPYISRSGHPQEAVLDKLLEPHNDGDKYPCPIGDEGIERYPYKMEVCGFESMEQLRRWFSSKEINILETTKFKICCVTGFITAIGERQVLFIPEKSIDVNSIDSCLELFECLKKDD